MSTTPTELADLRVAALRATPGPWSAKRHSADREPAHILTWPDTSKGGIHTRRLDSEFNGLFHKHDAEFIAAANPAAILALLDHIASTESRLHEVAVACATAEQERDELRLRASQVRASTIEECAKACETMHLGHAIGGSTWQMAKTCAAAIRRKSLPAAPNEEKP